MAVNPVTYVKNVGKSFGYIAMETLGATSPAMKELISDNKDTISDLYHQIKDFSSSPMDKVRSNQKIMSYSNDIKTGLSNLVSDIKTGNFYNQARSDDAMNSMLGLDFDFDSMFDEDFDFDSEISSSNSTTAATVAEGTNKEILAMDVVGSRISTAVGSATAKSAEYIVNANAESTRAILNQNSKIFSALSTGMVGINQTLGSIAQLGQPLTQHMQNSSVFYTKSTENQLKMIELLEKIEKNTARPVATKSGSGRQGIGYDAYLTGSGVLDLGKMLSMAKGNAKNAIDSSMLGMLFSMNDMLGEGTMTKMFAANPLGVIMPMVIEGALMTPELKKSLNNISKAISAASVKTLRDLNRLKGSTNPIFAFIGELFGLDKGSGYIKGDTSKYEKGAVSFDGYTRQAIIKVIPEYLSMILTALTGKEQKLYDYESGKFTTRSSIAKDIQKEFNRSVDRAGSDIKVTATSGMKNRNRIRHIDSLIDKYVANGIRTGRTIDAETHIEMSDDAAKKYGFKNKDELGEFVAIINDIKKGDEWYAIELLNQNIFSARIANGNASYDQMSARMYLFDNSYESHINRAIDKVQKSNRSSRTKGGSKKSGGSKSDEAAAAGGIYDSLNETAIRRQLTEVGATDKEIDKWISKFNGANSDSAKDKFEQDYSKRLEGDSVTTGIGKAKSFFEKIQSFIAAPMDALAGVINKGSKALYNIMYGKEGEEDNKSILGHIFINMKDMFNNFKNWAKETIFDPIKELIDKHGGVKGLFLDFFGLDEEGIKGKFNEIKANVGQRFRSVGNWISSNSRIAGAYRNFRDRNAGSGSGLMYRGGASGTENPMFGEQVINEGKNAILSFIHAIFPDKETLDKDLGKVGDVAKTSLKEMGADPSGAITGALIGTGVSILTGGIVGPFLAASLGGAAGLTLNSKAVQKALFGDVDEEGNASGGLLSSKVSTFLTRDLKKVAGYGIDGAILGLLPFVPGGPITGLLLGSAIGFANREGKLSDAIFGEKGKDGREGGLISKDFQEKVKRLAPKAAIGAIAGLVAGPFGLLPNLMIGAGIGFASETETFKRYIFGEDTGEVDSDGNPIRKGGLTGWIRKDIIDPVKSAIAPIAVEIKNKGLDIIRWTIRSIAGAFGKTVGSPLFEKLNEHLIKPLTQKVVPGLGKFIGGIISAPFKIFGGVGTLIRNKQIRQGRANDMSALARLEYRNNHNLGPDEFTDYDTIMAGLSDEEIAELTNEFSEAKKSRNTDQLNSFANKFSTKFGLQNKNISAKNIDKYMDTLKAESRNRKKGSSETKAINLDPEKVRNNLIDTHATRITTIVATIANHILNRDVFNEGISSSVTEVAESENNATPRLNSLGTTRRSFGQVVKSAFNPFTGMDMESVNEAISYYEDKLAGNYYGAYRAKFAGRGNEISKRVRKIEVNGELRDDVIEVTDKNGYSVIVQKKNGSWMPYKWGTQLKESLSGTYVGKLISGVSSTAKGVGKIIRNTFDPYFGMDKSIVNKALSLYVRQNIYGEPLTDEESEFLRTHITSFNEKYPNENVVIVNDGKRNSGLIRYDSVRGVWIKVGIGWKVGQFKNKVTNAIVSIGKKIGGTIKNAIDTMRHINPFCDFESEEISDIINSLNSIEFEGGSDTTGKIKKVPRLNHYYQVTSSNGSTTTVTAKGGRWVWVSPKQLQAAQARNVISGIGGMIGNVARGAVNTLFNNNIAGAPQGSGSKLRRWVGGAAGIALGYDILSGEAITGKIDASGKTVVDDAAKGNRDAARKRNALIEKFNELFENVKNIAGTVSEEANEEGEEGEKKKSLLERIFGEGGFFGKAKNWIMGSLPTILVTAGLAVFAKLGLEGKLNGIASKLGLAGRDNLNQGIDSGTDYTQWTGITEDGRVEAVATDEKGNPIMDEDGNYISTNGNVVTGVKSVYGNTNATLQQKLISNTARSAITGSGVIAQIGRNTNKLTGGALGRAAGKIGTKVATKVGETAVAQASHAAGTAAVNGLLGKIVEQLTKIATKLSTLPMLKGLGGAVQGMSDDLAENIAKNAAKKSAAEIGKGVLSVAAFAAKIALIAIDFEEGYNSAKRTLGIKDPTTGQKIISGLIRVFKNLIPIIGSLIPDKLFVNIAVKWVAPAMGIDTSEFMKQQADAQAELDAYNKENGTDLTWDEYVKQEGLESTWGENIINGAKTVGSNVVSGVKKAGAAVKTGFNYIKTGMGKAKDVAVDTFKNALTSIKNLGTFAAKGDIKGLLSSTWKPQNANGEDSNGIIDTIFSKVYDVAKILTLPSTAIGWVGNTLIGGIKEKISKIKQTIQKTVNAFKQMHTYAQDGNVSGIWSVNVDEEGGEKGGVTNLILGGISTIGKVIYTVLGVIHKITNPIKEIVDAAKGGIENIKEKVANWFNGDVEVADEFAGGSSFISQLDPSIAGRRFASSTIGANGCAPSVASMITGAPISATAGYATRRGFANRYGTSADYFGSVFNAAGIPAEYVYTGAGSAQDYLASRIASGSPTVLLGQDPYNTSKAYSPFGPGNHYVLATGMTRDGGVIIQDPESRTPNNIYDSSILNSVKVGIPTGGRSGLLRRLRGRGVADYQYNEDYHDSEYDWNADQYIKNQEYNSEYYSSLNTPSYDRANWQNYDYIEKPGINMNYDSRYRNTATGMNYGDSRFSTNTNAITYSTTEVKSYKNEREYLADQNRNKTPSNYLGNFHNEREWQEFEKVNKAQIAAINAATSIAKSPASTNMEIIWQYLRNKGLPEAGVAGIMGNFQQESGCNPAAVEGYYLKAYPGADVILSSNEAMDDYCLNILFPKSPASKPDKYMVDGHYYPGFGLAQWTASRSKAIIDTCKANGLVWSDLMVQLNYFWDELTSKYKSTYEAMQKATDPSEAAKVFASKFEVTSYKIPERCNYAVAIFNQFTGRSFTISATSTSSGGYNSSQYSSESSINSENGISGTSTKSNFSLLDFGSMFGKLVAAKFGKLGRLFGLSSGDETDSTAKDESTGGSRNQYSDEVGLNGVAYNQYSTIGQAQKALVDKMASIQGKIKYKYGANNVDGGIADCSATVGWAYRNALGLNIPRSSGAMYNSNMFTTIDKAPNLVNGSNNTNTGGPNLEYLQPGDIVLSSRGTSSPYGIGHVSMYVGNGQVLSHGSGMGPKIVNISGDNKYVMARRYTPFYNGSYGALNNSDNYIGNFQNEREWQAYAASQEANKPASNVIGNFQTAEEAQRSLGIGNYAASGSGLVYNIAQDGLNTVHRRHRGARSAFGGSSGLVNLSRYSGTRKAQYYRDLRGGASLTGIDNNEALIVMIKAIISLLTNVSANSDKIGGISEAINNLAAATAGSGDVGMQMANAQNAMGIGDTDKTIADLSNLLHSLAAGA